MLIRVTPEQLHGLSTQLSGGAAAIDGQLASLSSGLAPLAGGEWAGPASDQFRMLWEQWHDSGRRLREALEGISVLMSGAANAYAEAEQHVTASFRV